MVRAALGQRGAINRGPRPGVQAIPAISVVMGSLLSSLPIIATLGWWPDFGFLILIAWRLLRGDAFPAWWAAPLGFANDLLTGLPVGLSVALWTAAMLALDLLDRRTMWRDYWVEWLLAILLIVANLTIQWRIAAIQGAVGPFRQLFAPIAIAAFTFPLAAFVVARLDRWRLGR